MCKWLSTAGTHCGFLELQEASWLSRLTFSWVKPLMERALAFNLVPADLFQLPTDLLPEECASRLHPLPETPPVLHSHCHNCQGIDNIDLCGACPFRLWGRWAAYMRQQGVKPPGIESAWGIKWWLLHVCMTEYCYRLLWLGALKVCSTCIDTQLTHSQDGHPSAAFTMYLNAAITGAHRHSHNRSSNAPASTHFVGTGASGTPWV